MTDAKPNRLIRIFEKYGFVRSGGSKHMKYSKMVDGQIVTLNLSNHGVVKRNTVEMYRKQAGIPKEEFYANKF